MIKTATRLFSLLTAACMLAMAIPFAVSAALEEVNIYPAEGVETFDLALTNPPWSGTVNVEAGTVGPVQDPDDSGNMALEMHRTTDQRNINYGCSPADVPETGQVGIEFDVKMRGTDNKKIQVILRDTGTAALASYYFIQGRGVQIRDGGYVDIPGSPKLASTDDYVHVKIMVDNDANTVTTTVGDSEPYVLASFQSPSADVFRRFHTMIDASEAGMDVYFDNLWIYRLAEVMTDEEAVAQDLAAIAFQEDLTALDTDLVLPREGTNMTTITWESSDEDVISSNGVISVGPTEGHAILTATVSRNGYSDTRDFEITVPADPTRGKLEWVSVDNFDDGAMPPLWQSAVATVQDGKLVLAKLAEGSAGMTRNITNSVNGDLFIEHEYTMNADVEGKALQEQIRGFNDAGQTVTLMTLRFMQGSQPAYRTVSESGSARYVNIGTADMAKKGTTHTIRYRINLIDQRMEVSIDGIKVFPDTENVEGSFPGTTDYVASLASTYWTSGTGDYPIVFEVDNYRVGLQEGYKQIVDNDLAALSIPNSDKLEDDFTLTVDGELGSAIEWESDNAAIEIGANGTAAVTRPPSDAADIQVNLTATATRGVYSDSRTITVTVKRELTDQESVDEAAKELTDAVLLGQNPDIAHISSDLSLPTAWSYGTAVSWVSASPIVVVDGQTGRVNGDLIDEDSPSVQVELTATISKAGLSTQKTFTVTVLNPGYTNIASGMTAKASSALSTNLANMAVDDKIITAWVANASDKAPYLTLDLGASKAINRIELVEKNSVMKSFRIETSQNGSNWAVLTTGGPIGDGQTWVYTPDAPVTTKYLRYYVTDKDAGETGLYEFRAYMRYNDKVRVQEDLAAIEIPNADAVTSDITLPKTGANGSAFTWSSSDESIVDAQGNVTRPTKTKSVTLTVTGKLGDATAQRSIPVKVLGTGGGSGGSGGTGGGGGGGSYVGGQRNDSTVLPPAPDKTQPESQPESIFADVPEGHWAKAYVEDLYEKNIINGVDADNFAPDRTITRAEFVKILAEAFGLGTGVYEGGFSDVTADDWFAGYIATAQAYGLAQGMGDGSFGAAAPISRQDMAVMVCNAVAVSGKTLPDSGDMTFTDGGEIAQYAQQSVQTLADNGILSGTPEGAFEPQATATRAEVAKVVCLLLEKLV